MSKAVQRGIEAGRELEVTRSAFDAVRAQIVKDWLNSKDPLERERLHAKASALDAVKTELLAAVAAGKMADKDD